MSTDEHTTASVLALPTFTEPPSTVYPKYEGTLEMMRYVDEINMRYGGEGTKLYSTAGTKFKKACIQYDLHLLDASVRHLGTDINYVVLENLYAYLKDRVDFFFDTPVETVKTTDGGYVVLCGEKTWSCEECIISVGRSGSKWMEKVMLCSLTM